MRRAARALIVLLASAGTAHAGVVVRAAAPAEIVFDSATQSCDGDDIPDVNARAFRDGEGQVVLFAMHLKNRAFRGADLDHVKLDCHVPLKSGFDADPAAYNDRSFITATWTADGREVAALVHHEYHADTHGKCRASGDLACWYNSILAYRSADGGRDFEKVRPTLVAGAPFPQDVGQGRHRGFFNPSNIFSDGRFAYVFASTTGWDGQAAGPCLFRSANPLEPGSWRAYDGTAFSIRYADPYTGPRPQPAACAVVAPFGLPVGAVVRLRDGGGWLAVYQATANAGAIPVDGFYYTTSTDLLHWSAPHLLKAGKTLYSDLCTAGGAVIAYPSLLDPTTPARNFDESGDAPYLYYAVISLKGCAPGARQLVRERLAIHADRRAGP
jgi:hypothetical protein